MNREEEQLEALISKLIKEAPEEPIPNSSYTQNIMQEARLIHVANLRQSRFRKQLKFALLVIPVYLLVGLIAANAWSIGWFDPMLLKIENLQSYFLSFVSTGKLIVIGILLIVHAFVFRGITMAYLIKQKSNL